MSVAPAVSIRGDGVAVATAAHLLASDGFDLVGAGNTVCAAAPVVMLSDTALALLRDVFGKRDLFVGNPRITRRIVAWGGGEPATMPHTAVAVPGLTMAAELAAPRLSPGAGSQIATLYGAPPFPQGATRRFGSREALAAAVTLAPGADARACYIEATASGWLFLVPQGDGYAWLLGVGDTLDALLGTSTLVAPQIGSLGAVEARFETAPRMLDVVAGADWLACGTAAIAFDPICGDGTAQAAREGILAAAVFAGLRDGGDSSALLGHYQAMLLAAMRRHLQISLPFYRSGGASAWWREQADALAEGYDWCTARLGATPEPRFLLRGTRLVSRELAA